MKTDEVIDGVLIKATQPEKDEPYVWPDGVTAIGDYAFYNWYNFNQQFSIPKSVTEIGNGSFAYWDTFNQKFSIPKSVTKIGQCAFSHWFNFNQPFSIPKSVTEIGEYAFSHWLSFNQPFSIPKGVTEIESYAFSYWTSFDQSNSRRAKATSDWFRIDDWVFAGCYTGTLEQLRKRLDSGESTPEREKAWKIISQPF
jgi:hypothetical protein